MPIVHSLIRHIHQSEYKVSKEHVDKHHVHFEDIRQ